MLMQWKTHLIQKRMKMKEFQFAFAYYIRHPVHIYLSKAYTALDFVLISTIYHLQFTFSPKVTAMKYFRTQ